MIEQEKLDSLQELCLSLRRKLRNDLSDFFSNNKNLTQEMMFVAVSMALSSLTADVVYHLFKKDIGNEPPLRYIDNICDLAKDQLIKFKKLVNIPDDKEK